MASLLSLILLLLASGLSLPAFAQGRRWREVEAKPLVQFTWACTSPLIYPKARLGRIVRATMKRMDFDGYGTGDRAFAFDLNGDSKPEYFVPLYRGATGNVAWGLYSLSPVRQLSLLDGMYIYVHRARGRYPVIFSYTHMSAWEGYITTYRLRKGRYVTTKALFRTDARGSDYGNELPRFITSARPVCEKFDY